MDLINPESFEYQFAHIHDDRSMVLKVLAIVGAVLATAAVGLRIHSRRLVHAPLKADDWTIILSLILMYGLWAIIFVLVWHNGVGKHEITLPLDLAKQTIKLLYVFQILYQATYPTIKISVLLLYERVFALPRFQLLVKCLIAIMFMWQIATVLVGIFWCTPVSAFWDNILENAPNCVDENGSYVANASINVVTDLVILVLPMPIIVKLHISRRQKIVLCSIFVLGSLVFVATVFRIVAFYQIDYSDRTYTYVNSAIWTVVEIPLSIICACLPTMRPLFRGMLSTIASARAGSASRSGALSAKKGAVLKVFNSKGQWTSITEGTVTTNASTLVPNESTMEMGAMPGRPKEPAEAAASVTAPLPSHIEPASPLNRSPLNRNPASPYRSTGPRSLGAISPFQNVSPGNVDPTIESEIQPINPINHPSGTNIIEINAAAHPYPVERSSSRLGYISPRRRSSGGNQGGVAAARGGRRSIWNVLPFGRKGAPAAGGRRKSVDRLSSRMREEQQAAQERDIEAQLEAFEHPQTSSEARERLGIGRAVGGSPNTDHDGFGAGGQGPVDETVAEEPGPETEARAEAEAGAETETDPEPGLSLSSESSRERINVHVQRDVLVDVHYVASPVIPPITYPPLTTHSVLSSSRRPSRSGTG
ncbi:MAG: hypothetical protein M1838_004451 [Thelocarpon superellum]|nr:MAG: hypothetical protein M1838_004451 [Thelocarpon superellum]